MRTEGRLDELNVKKEEEDAEDKKEEDDDEKKEEQEPQVIIEEDDCFEYKLVGVNVHSGSANAGHYWSYINTKRGFEEHPGEDQRWEDTEADQWMEYNDSTVKDFSTKNIKSECYGDAPSGN